MDKNTAWKYISCNECYYLENTYNEPINSFIIANLEWINSLCSRIGIEFHYLPADFEGIDTEKANYHLPFSHSVSPHSITSKVYAALFPDDSTDHQVCGLLLYDESCGDGLPMDMAMHPIESGGNEYLKQQFTRLLQNYKPYVSDTRFSFCFPSNEFKEPVERIKLSKSEIEKIEEEIRERVQRLRLSDVDELIIQSLFDKEERLSRVNITKDYKILLPDYGLEVQMAPLTKAIYLLFLKHPEGIRFKELADHEDELYTLYHRITNRLDIFKQKKSVRSIVQPFSNDINIHVSRIKQAFTSQFSEELSAYYIIGGGTGEAKQIKMPREYVSWEV